MSTFREHNASTARQPHRGPIGLALARAIGDEQDTEAALLRTALLCRMSSRCPDDALDLVGAWFRIGRYPGETDASYRARLLIAWPTWEMAGSAAAIEAQIQAYGVPDVRVWTVADDTWRAGPGPGEFSHFDVVLGPNFGTSPLSILGMMTLGVATLAVDPAARAFVREISRIVLKWKASHGYPVRVIVVFDAASKLHISTTLGTWVLGGGSESTWWQIGHTMSDTNSTLGTWVLGGYEPV